jgi:hypothetical protein
MLLDF